MNEKNNIRNIIVGASGTVGSNIIKALSEKNIPSVAVIRNKKQSFSNDVTIRYADLLGQDQVIDAFKGGSTAFLITPESFTAFDILNDTKKIIQNYRTAILKNNIQRIVCLSCVGAHVDGHTGNILMSRELENSFDDMDIEKIIIRPSYYYKNWIGYITSVRQSGILLSFFEENQKIAMNSPVDLAKFISEILASPILGKGTKIYEFIGPKSYSARDIADCFEKFLKKEVSVLSIPRENWKETLLSIGFSENVAVNLSEMTEALADGIAVPENPEKTIVLKTNFETYFQSELNFL